MRRCLPVPIRCRNHFPRDGPRAAHVGPGGDDDAVRAGCGRRRSGARSPSAVSTSALCAAGTSVTGSTGRSPVVVSCRWPWPWPPTTASPVGLHRIEINIRPENGPSIRVVEKLGFRYEGLRERYLHIDGDWRDHVSLRADRRRGQRATGRPIRAPVRRTEGHQPPNTPVKSGIRWWPDRRLEPVLTGLLYAAVIAMWAVVLLPRWLGTSDKYRDARTTQRFRRSLRSVSVRRHRSHDVAAMPGRARQSGGHRSC